MKLILAGLDEHPYAINPFTNKHMALCAYIFYQHKKKIVDNFKQEIGDFYQSPFVFEQHLKEKVLPHIQKILEKSEYITNGVDFVNMCPRPFFQIVRKDKMPVSQKDIDKVRKILNESLYVEEVKKNSVFAYNPPAQHEAPKHTYNTRSMTKR